MTTGIYRLTFLTGDTYIGKSVNIEDRFREHVQSMQEGNASIRMQVVYRNSHHNLPNFETLVTCHEDYLDYFERYYVNKLNPNINQVKLRRLTLEQIRVLEEYPTYFKYSALAIIRDLSRHHKDPNEEIASLNEQIGNLKQKLQSTINVLKTKNARNWWQRLLDK